MNKLGTSLLSTIFLALGLERLATRLDSVSSHPSIIDKEKNSSNLFPTNFPTQVGNQKQQSHKLFPSTWPTQVANQKQLYDKLFPSVFPTQLATINKSS